MLSVLGRQPAAQWWLDWHLSGVALLFVARLVHRADRANALPGLAGEAMHGLTQLGTIAFAFRQWLGWRYGQFGGPAVAQASGAATAEAG